MTVRVNKPAINLREELADLRKPTGIAGEAMLRAETPQEQFNLIGAGRRNLIINGAMQVAQRGTSASYGVGDNGYKTVDRWRFNVSGNVDQFVATASQDTDAPAGFSNSVKTLVTTAETGIGGGDERTSIETRIEAQDLQMLNYGSSDAQDMTLSFWVKSNVTGKFSVNFRAHDQDDAYNTPYFINSADTWEYKTVYIKGNTLSGSIANDNGIGIWVRFMLFVSADQRNDSFTNNWVASSAASYGPTDMQSEWGLTVNDYFQITGVQLEVGKVATPFEHRSYGEELALCQRYFCKLDFPQTSPIGPVHKQTTNTIRTLINLPVPMRAEPSINSTGQPSFFLYWSVGGTDSSATNTSGTAFSVVGNSLDNARVTLSAGVGGIESLIGSFFGYSGDLNFDAEL